MKSWLLWSIGWFIRFFLFDYYWFDAYTPGRGIYFTSFYCGLLLVHPSSGRCGAYSACFYGVYYWYSLQVVVALNILLRLETECELFIICTVISIHFYCMILFDIHTSIFYMFTHHFVCSHPNILYVHAPFCMFTPK